MLAFGFSLEFMSPLSCTRVPLRGTIRTRRVGFRAGPALFSLGGVCVCVCVSFIYVLGCLVLCSVLVWFVSCVCFDPCTRHLDLCSLALYFVSSAHSYEKAVEKAPRLEGTWRTRKHIPLMRETCAIQCSKECRDETAVVPCTRCRC